MIRQDFLFVGLHYLPIWKIRISKKKKKDFAQHHCEIVHFLALSEITKKIIISNFTQLW